MLAMKTAILCGFQLFIYESSHRVFHNQKTKIKRRKQNEYCEKNTTLHICDSGVLFNVKLTGDCVMVRLNYINKQVRQKA